uniref:RAD54B DNA helicase splice variant n=1 Tax=Physcomitrium patens TaxID=3218 RepID=A0A1P8CMH0_PHYPA|nr:RAD54B DNA helicase splice variant [Physcomitrium patens]
MRRSAAPSMLAKKLQEQGKENVINAKSAIFEKAGGSEPFRNIIPSRKRFRTPFTSPQAVVSPRTKLHSAGGTESYGSEGLAICKGSNVVRDAPTAGRKPSQVLQLMQSRRIGTMSNISSTVSDQCDKLSPQSASPLDLYSASDIVEKVAFEEGNSDLFSKADLETIPGNSSSFESSCAVGAKRDCPEDGELENASLDVRKKHCPAEKEGEPLLSEKGLCVEQAAAISKETVACAYDRLNEDLKLDLIPSGGADTVNLKENLESTSNKGEGEPYVHVKEDHNDEVVSLSSKPTNPEETLHGPHRQFSSLHGVNLLEAVNHTHELPTTVHYLVMYCPRKKNAKRKGPWSDGIIVCQGRSCTLQDMDSKVVSKSNFQGLKDMPEGATLEVGKFEVEVMRKASNEEVLSGTLYMANKLLPSIPIQCPLKTLKKQPFKSSKLDGSQQSRDKGPFMIPMDAWKLNEDSSTEVPVVVDPYIASKLRPHQKDGVMFMYECIMGLRSNSFCGCLLADEMGLGKTLQVITLIWTILKQGPGGSPAVKRVLVVCPSSLVHNWGNEVHKWLGRERLRFMAAAQKFADFKAGFSSPLLITSYEILRKHIDIIASTKPGLLVCDEAHRLKNCAGNKTIDALVGLQCPRKILLTGTPVQNDLNEFYAMIDFANPGLLGPLSSFKRIFAEPIERSQDRTASEEEQKLGQARSLELQSRTEFCILRRTANINEAYLPTKTEFFVFCRLHLLQISFYNIITARALRSVYMTENVSATILSSITSLRKLCSHPQLSYNDIIEGTNLDAELKSQIIAAGLSRFSDSTDNIEVLQSRASLSDEGWKFSGKLACLYWLLRTVYTSRTARQKDRVVVVSNFTRTLDLIQDMCTSQGWNWLRLDGSTEASKRQLLVDQLNSGVGDVFVFLLSSKAGGTGLNLIGANRLVLFDPDWNPATDSQAIARIWREGQLKPVLIYRLLSTGSIEEKIYQRQIMKGGMSAAVEGDADVHTKKSNIGRHFSKEELKELFTLNLATNCDTFDLISRTKTAPAKTWMDDSENVDDPALQSAIKSGIVSFVYNDRRPAPQQLATV